MSVQPWLLMSVQPAARKHKRAVSSPFATALAFPGCNPSLLAPCPSRDPLLAPSPVHSYPPFVSLWHLPQPLEASFANSLLSATHERLSGSSSGAAVKPSPIYSAAQTPLPPHAAGRCFCLGCCRCCPRSGPCPVCCLRAARAAATAAASGAGSGRHRSVGLREGDRERGGRGEPGATTARGADCSTTHSPLPCEQPAAPCDT